MGMIHRYWYFESTAAKQLRRNCGYLTKPEATINGIRCVINSATFAFFINNKSHKRYSSKDIPKYANVRGAIFC